MKGGMQERMKEFDLILASRLPWAHIHYNQFHQITFYK